MSPHFPFVQVSCNDFEQSLNTICGTIPEMSILSSINKHCTATGRLACGTCHLIMLEQVQKVGEVPNDLKHLQYQSLS
jgi:hypothetical protein